MDKFEKQTKGMRTAQRIMDVAEGLFARRGYDGTPLREIAAAAGLKEPALYNHFRNKEDLYRAVLERGLQPLVDVISDTLTAGESDPGELAALPSTILGRLAEHPTMAQLFQRALMEDSGTTAGGLMDEWLNKLFSLGNEVYRRIGLDVSELDAALYLIASFNLSTGYFNSSRLLKKMTGKECTDEESLARQTRILNDFLGTFAGPIS
jgi:AcrR family transcriptional regulator